jgi:hypothetical protein
MSTYTPNPDNLPVTVGLPDDGFLPNAATFNTGYQGALDIAQSALARVLSSACSNWKASSSMGSVSTAVVDWDPTNMRWVSAGNAGPAALLATHDSGTTWANVHTTSGVAIAVTATNLFGDIVMFMGGASDTFNKIDASGNLAFGNASVLGNVTGAAMDYFLCEFGGNVANTHTFAFKQTGGTFAAMWLFRQDGAGTFPGMTNNTAQLPAGFASGTLHVGQILVANTTKKQRTAVPGDIQVVAYCGATPGTDAPKLMNVTSQGSGTPMNITDITANIPAPGPSVIITGLAYDEDNFLWALAHSTTPGAGGTYLYSSQNLVSWTLVHQFSGYPAGNFAGVACVSGVWAVWVGANTLTSDTTNSNRVLYSWDVFKKGGSSLWRSAQGMSLAPQMSTLPFSQLVSNGSQLIANQGGSSPLSQISHDAGYPPGFAGTSGLY